MSPSGIYFIRNTVTDRVYVGSSRNIQRRFSEHRSRLSRGVHCNARLQASWNKHGAKAFSFEVVASVLNEDEIEPLEQQFIDELNAVETGYNLAPTAGNTAGWKASLETRERMSQAAKKRDHSAQVKAMAAATTGKKRPQYVIDAMQAGRRNKALSCESRQRMSLAATARSRYSSDDRRRMSEMRDSGASWRAIADSFGVTGHAAVMVYVKRWRLENDAR